MDGPTFLFLYVLIAAAVIGLSRWFVWIADKSGWRSPPPVPATFDPYEIAYLRGGKNAVIRTAMYALYSRGLVEIIPGKWFKASTVVARDAAADGQSGGPLTGLEDVVRGSIRAPAQPAALFQGTLGGDVEQLCEPYRRGLQSEDLVRSDATRFEAQIIPWTATFILVAVGLARWMASSPGAKVGGLAFLMAVSIGLLWWLAGSRAAAAISERGRTWLKQIQTAYQGVPLSPVAMVGLFGLEILNNTSDAEFAKLFAKGNDGSGCGGGCGSGCGGGGGCGGD
jgi:uncharacterized protein (TIGR04222 family)